MFDGLLGRGSASKCKSLIKLIKSRIDILRKKRNSKASLLRKDVAQLIIKGHDHSAFSRVELLLVELSLLGGYDMIEFFCECILERLSYIQKHKDCPPDIREAVSSLIFAAARCADLPELQGLRGIFAMKYGDEFAVAAVELLPDCGVNQQMIEKLLPRTISSDAKLKLMKEIAEEVSFQWDPSNLKAKIFNPSEDSLDGSQGLHGCKSTGSYDPLPDRSLLDGTSIHPLNNGFSVHGKSSNVVKKQEGGVLDKRVQIVSSSVGCKENIYDTHITAISSSARDTLVNPDAVGAVAEPADHENPSNKPCIKEEVIDSPFDASSETREDDRNRRYSTMRPESNKISRHSSNAEGNDLKRQYSNGHTNTSFLEEDNGVYERNSGLRSVEQLKLDTTYKRSTRRASNLMTGKEEPQEFSEGPENGKLQDDCNITRRGSLGTNNELNRFEANGVQAESQRRHNKESMCKEQDDLKRFDRPVEVWDVNAGQEHKSEFCDIPTYRSKARLKSNKILDHCAVQKNNLYPCEYDDNAGRFLVGNRADHRVNEPTMKESIEKKQYPEHFLESQEQFKSKRSSLHNLDKSDPTRQHRKDKTGYEAYNGCNRPHDKLDYCNDIDSNDAIFVEEENTNAVRDGLSPVYKRPSSRESRRRVNYVNEEATFDGSTHNSRMVSDKSTKSRKSRSYEGVDSFQQSEHGGKYETYYSDGQRFHENNNGNSASVDRLPSQQHHREEGTKLSKHAFRANHRMHGLDEPSRTKNLNQIDDQSSDLEAQSSWRSEYTNEYTRPEYLQCAEFVKRPKEGSRTRESKPHKGRDKLVDSLNSYPYHIEKHNSDFEEHYVQEFENPQSYVKETPLAGDISERRHSHRRHIREGRPPDGSCKLPEGNEGYLVHKERLGNSLDNESNISSEKNNRCDRQQSERKQKVHHTFRDSNVRIVEEGNGLRHYSEQAKDHQLFRGGHAIPRAEECSPVKGRIHDIQEAKLCRSRITQSASHQVQSHDHNQSVCSESATVKKCSKSMMPPSIQEARDSHTSPYDFTINGSNPPLPPKSPAPTQASISPEFLSQAKPQHGKPTRSPRRPPPEHQRAVSLPTEHSRSSPLHPAFSKSASDVGSSNMAHVHPKLPDYDDLAARFAALRQQSKTK